MKHGYFEKISYPVRTGIWYLVWSMKYGYSKNIVAQVPERLPRAEELLPAKLLKRFNRRILYSSLAANDPLRSNDDSSSRQIFPE
ncbi:hypothetical protein ACSBR1_029508 [Camellia fascicularis]